MEARILIVEDDLSTARSLQKVLRDEGYSVEVSTRGDQGLAIAQQQSFDVVLTDFKLPGLGGLEVVRQLHAHKPKLPIILMTAHGTTETAIESTKLGACEYLMKPFEADELLDLIDSCIAYTRRMSEIIDIGEARSDRPALIGNSRSMQNVYKEIGRVAATSATVLIRGETGTGKEMVARAIYQHSHRASKPFIAVNCAAIPDTLLESELFGHERGAFTGAHAQRIGRFEQAHGGTIFLDEIGDLHPNTQAKLLRVLQEQSIQRLGGNETIPIDVRLLAATHRDLEVAIKERAFREDLFYRLSVVTIYLPPLRERADDIPDLVRYFVRRYAKDLPTDQPAIEPEAITYLKTQLWPGNVRELENAIRQALLIARPFAIGVDHVQVALGKSRRISQAATTQSHAAYITDLLARAQRGEITDAFDRMVADLEPELYSQAIALAGGNQAKAARWLGVTRLKMREKLHQLGLHPSSQAETSNDPR